MNLVALHVVRRTETPDWETAMPWFWPHKRKSSPVDHMLSLADEEFARLTLAALADEIPATHAMIVVAYENLRVTVMFYEDPRSHSQPPITLDELIRMTASRMEGEKDPMISRRLHWFFSAALVARLNRLTVTNPTLEGTAAEVWYLLASGGRYLKALLAQNVVWSPDEKEWFMMLRDERDGVEHVLRLVMPSRLLQHPKLRELAEQNEVMTLYASGTIW